MTALFAGLTTIDVLHGLNHTPDPHLKVTSNNFLLAAGGPATNAAVTHAALEKIATHNNETHTTLLTALGSGALSEILKEDLTKNDVQILDATDPDTPSASAISSIIDHPTGRMVASTNARVNINLTKAYEALTALAADELDAVLIDGHNPELANLALRLGTSHFPASGNTIKEEANDKDPFADLEEKPSHQRILDGGSWKPWLPPLLGLIDIAVISADFTPPLLANNNPEAIAEFLRGFGIHKIIRTNGANPVQWWWDEAHGETPVPSVDAVSTLGAGDIFHGAFTWGVAQCQRNDVLPSDPITLITFASRIAAISVTHFGTRTWVQDSDVAQAVAEFLPDRGA